MRPELNSPHTVLKACACGCEISIHVQVEVEVEVAALYASISCLWCARSRACAYARADTDACVRAASASVQ